MPVINSRLPPEASGEFNEIIKAASMFESHSFRSRPISALTETTDIFDTDFEDESDFDEPSPKRSFDSDDGRRRSQTTISSYDEVTTPGLRQINHAPFDLRIQPVEGPKGPHLFRSSQASSDFNYEHALQLSPLFPKEMVLPAKAVSASQHLTPTAHSMQNDFSITTAIETTADSSIDPEAHIRAWSTQQVIDWMYETGIDSSVIECFDIHDINGAVLLDLQFEDLKDLDIQSFGKRHQLWNAICLLRGDDPSMSFQPSPPRENNPNRAPSRTRGYSNDERPTTPTSGPRRRGRSVPGAADLVTPAESVSIVAIEQLLPKPHICQKGDRCTKWRKQQKEIQQLQATNGIGRFPLTSNNGSRYVVQANTGDITCSEGFPSNTSHYETEGVQHVVPQSEAHLRPTSNMVPSVVASSDLLGPGFFPEFVLQQDTLNQLGARDPQDNVKQFLNFQHMNSPLAETRPPTPPLEMFPSNSTPSFPAQYQYSHPPPRNNSGPHEQLKTLPKLEIPRSVSADPQSNAGPGADATQLMVCRSATASPGRMYRVGTPASEVDVPLTTVPLGPVSRDTSQSVPPNMQYRPQGRSQSRPADRRRPSLAPVKEGEVFSPSSDHLSEKTRPSISSSRSTDSVTQQQRARDPAHYSPQTQYFGYGEDCTHAGWMKKRRTKMLRHEWQDAHFRLKGSQLAMHANARLSTAASDTINVDDYAVACTSVASGSKLSAAMKALTLKHSSDAAKKDAADATAFAFQLIPAPDPDRRQVVNSKTHHFAVKTKDERIDWMREIMLAKALHQKGKGYEVEINGQKA